MSLNLLLASTGKPRACIGKSRGFSFSRWLFGFLEARDESRCLHNKIAHLAAVRGSLAASIRHQGMSDVSNVKPRAKRVRGRTHLVLSSNLALGARIGAACL